MADYKVQLKDKDGNRQYPVTSTTLVVDEQGKTAEQRLREIEEMLIAMEQATIQPLYEKQ
jgi:hypothetical protein